MARDSLFGERIVWRGRCIGPSVPFAQKVMAVAAAIAAAVTLCHAVVVAKSLDVPVGGMILFSAWCASLSLCAWRVPVWWRHRIEYLVTERHVIWRRGRLRRSIERKQISYALVRWKGGDRSVGDLALVRAVPTGALKRTLSLTLHDVAAPDRLWALIRGVEPGAPLGSGERPLAQRLDPGERVLWSGAPLASRWTARRAAMAFVGGCLLLSFVRCVVREVPSIVRVLRLHALAPSLAALLVLGAALGLSMLLALTAGVSYAAVFRPARLTRRTRYFVTDARVLIQRGQEELSLDRTHIAYVIDAPSRNLHDIFLVLDGPHARAMAPSGAFGGEAFGSKEGAVDGLKPVFTAIRDADTVGRILVRIPAKG